MSQQIQLENHFSNLGIDITRPEFYNHPRFREEESRNPKLLWDYTDYVISRSYSEEYIAKSVFAVPKIIQFLFDSLVQDGRLGACLDASLAASKILERYGFWNTIQTGSLTINVPEAQQRRVRHWAELRLPGNPAKVGHAWLVVPPYMIVDFTASRQQENEDLQSFLSPFILATVTDEVEGVSLDDMVDVDLKRWYFRMNGRLPTIHEIMKQAPEFAEYMRRFRPISVRDGTATLKYFPCRPTAAEESLEDHTGHCFSGRRTPEVLRDLAASIGTPDEIGWTSCQE
jgi:hypothetical protein